MTSQSKVKKILKININKIKRKGNFYFTNEIKKNVLEKIFYFNPSIFKVNFTKNYVLIFLSENYNSKFEKKIIKNLKNIISSNTRISENVLYENKIKLKNKNFNAYKEMLKKKIIKKIGIGLYSFSDTYRKFEKKIDEIFKTKIKIKDFSQRRYSGLIPLNSLILNGYIKSFPQHCFFVSNPYHSLSSINSISKIISDKKNLKKNTSFSDYTLSPTVCFNCFEELKKRNIKKNLKISAIANCYRYESMNYKTLERLRVYLMREYIFFGDKKFVSNQLKKYLLLIKKILISFKIKFRIVTANDPFFKDDQVSKKLFQNANELKFEFQVYIPFEKKWLAVASVNNHLDTLSKSYKIKNNQKVVNSGCIGVGYERLIYSIFSQKKKMKND